MPKIDLDEAARDAKEKAVDAAVDIYKIFTIHDQVKKETKEYNLNPQQASKLEERYLQDDSNGEFSEVYRKTVNKINEWLGPFGGRRMQSAEEIRNEGKRDEGPSPTTNTQPPSLLDYYKKK